MLTDFQNSFTITLCTLVDRWFLAPTLPDAILNADILIKEISSLGRHCNASVNLCLYCSNTTRYNQVGIAQLGDVFHWRRNHAPRRKYLNNNK